MTTYVVTGAGRGLGRELVRQLVARGEATRVVATVRDSRQADELRSLVHTVFPLDVSSEESIAALGERLGEGSVDVLVNNAGVSGQAKSVADLNAAELERVFRVNAFGAILVTRTLLPHLRRGRLRVVVNITSELGSISRNRGGSTYAYRASKAALNQLTVCLANELKREGFTCVALHPGWVRTDMGGPLAPLLPHDSAAAMLTLIDRLRPTDTGRFFNYDGSPLEW